MATLDAGSPVWMRPAVIDWSALLLDSYYRWAKEQLFARRNPQLDAQALFKSVFEVVSHGVEDDPIFNYANRSALKLWETDWDRFTAMPSHLSAEDDPVVQAERSRALERVKELGCIRHYQGIRITTTGRRFEIQDGFVWMVLDVSGKPVGLAAMLSHYKLL